MSEYHPYFNGIIPQSRPGLVYFFKNCISRAVITHLHWVMWEIAINCFDCKALRPKLLKWTNGMESRKWVTEKHMANVRSPRGSIYHTRVGVVELYNKAQDTRAQLLFSSLQHVIATLKSCSEHLLGICRALHFAYLAVSPSQWPKTGGIGPFQCCFSNERCSDWFWVVCLAGTPCSATSVLI